MFQCHVFGDVEVAVLCNLGVHVCFCEARDVGCADVAARHFGEEEPLREVAGADEEEGGVVDFSGGVAVSGREGSVR